jgi:hypothetical protein
MRNIFLFFIVGLSSLVFGSEKTYIQPDQIAFAQDGIYVQIDNQWIPTESIHADACGIYVTEDTRDITHWICPRCHHENGLFTRRCKNCGY